MKSIVTKNRSTEFLQLFSLLLLASGLFYSCKKDVVHGTQMQVNVINASAGSGSVELLQNLKPVGSFSYLTGLNSTAAYRKLDSGFNEYRLRSGNTDLVKWFYANTGSHYTFFFCDTATTAKLKYFFLEDVLDTVGLGKRSKIRLVNACPDAGVLDLLTTKPSNPLQDSILVGERTYSGNATAAELTATAGFQNFYADSTVYIKVRKKATGVILRQYQLMFAKGGIYSILVKGYAANTGADSLSLSLIKHN